MMSQPNKTKFGYYDVKLNTSVLLVLMFCNQSNSKLRFLVTFYLNWIRLPPTNLN